MDLQALTTQQLQLTLKLSDLLSIEDLTVAAAVLASYDWNIENAVAELQIGSPQQHVNPIPPAQLNPVISDDYSYENGQNQNYEIQDQNEDQYQYLFNQKKKMFEEEYVSLLPLQKSLSQPHKNLKSLQAHRLLAKDTRAHRNEYFNVLMKQSEQICKKILETNKQNKNKFIQNRRKIENNRQFINYLYQNYKPNVNFTFGTFFLNLTKAYLEDKYLLVYIHSIKPQVQNKFKKVVELILRQKEIAKFVNQNCITYGMFDNSDDYEVIQKHLPLKDLPAFCLFKLNKSKRSEEFVSTYKIQSQDQIFLEWLASSMQVKLLKREESQAQLQKKLKQEVKQAQIKKKKEEQKIKKQMKQQQQYIAHRDIRQQQDQLWAQLQKTYKQKKQLSFDRKQKIKQDEQDLRKRIELASAQMEPEAGPNVIQVRFKMPVSGEAKSRRFMLQDKIQKLFTYVDCFCRDEFQQKFNDFDLRQSFPQLSLADKKDKTINEVFQGSNRENIVVRQL